MADIKAELTTKVRGAAEKAAVTDGKHKRLIAGLESSLAQANAQLTMARADAAHNSKKLRATHAALEAERKARLAEASLQQRASDDVEARRADAAARQAAAEAQLVSLQSNAARELAEVRAQHLSALQLLDAERQKLAASLAWRREVFSSATPSGRAGARRDTVLTPQLSGSIASFWRRKRRRLRGRDAARDGRRGGAGGAGGAGDADAEDVQGADLGAAARLANAESAHLLSQKHLLEAKGEAAAALQASVIR